MNREKAPINNRLAKKLSKEIDKKGKAEVHLAPNPTLPIPHPLKPTVRMVHAEKEIAAPRRGTGKNEHHKILHKRTNTGQPLTNSSPAHVHPEGKRWIKTLQKQTAVKKVVNTKKFAKRSPR
jgi:hypothetical protein